MDTLRLAAEMGARSSALRSAGKTIAFVPTMGALHRGHLSLIAIAAERADAVVVSIFVNPLQFGRGEDFESYPRDEGADARLAESAGCSILFAPDASQIYPPGFSTTIDVGPVGRILEGAARPGHFNGVATVVATLFNIVRPHTAVFGEKDAQQVVVVRKLVRELDLGVEVATGPIVREPDGLALSSRNVYLTRTERAASAVIYKSLLKARAMAASGERDCGRITTAMRSLISAEPEAGVEYISAAHPETLEELPALNPGEPALLSLAVKFGRTRLIDNLIVTCT